VILNDLARKEP